MCIRDRLQAFDAVLQPERFKDYGPNGLQVEGRQGIRKIVSCLLYTSDAADERSSVDLGGRRIIKKKNSWDRGGSGGRDTSKRAGESNGSKE